MNIFRSMLACLCVLMICSSSTYSADHSNYKSRLDSIITEMLLQFSAPAPPEVVILKVSGEVTVKWADSLEAICRRTSNPRIVLWIESGGGGVQETEVLTHRILNIKAKYNKTIIAYTERFLCSGAYWVACVADSLYSSPAAIVGSIGVYIVRLDITVYDSLLGGKYDVIKTGALKDAGDYHTKMTTEERAFWQAWVDKSYTRFINHIYSHRETQLSSAWLQMRKDPSPKAMLVRAADGRIYTAEEALTLGLVDRVLYMDDMIAQLGNNVVVNLVEVAAAHAENLRPMIK